MNYVKDVIRVNGNVKKVITEVTGIRLIFIQYKGEVIRDNFLDPCRPEVESTHYKKMRNQARAIFTENRQISWTELLDENHVKILQTGELFTTRLQKKEKDRNLYETIKDKYGNLYEKIPEKTKDIDAAIRRQDHIISGYLVKKNKIQKTDIPNGAAIEEFLKKLPIVIPFFELRKQILIFVKKQMDKAILQAAEILENFSDFKTFQLRKTNLIKADVKKCLRILDNNWPAPYLEKIVTIKSLLNEALKILTKNPEFSWKLIKGSCNRLKDVLLTIGTKNDLERLSEINPILTLSLVHKNNKTDLVLELVKKFLHQKCNLRVGNLFKIEAFMVVSDLILSNTGITDRGQICYYCKHKKYCPNSKSAKN